MSTSRKHVTSSLSCRHLPNIGGTTGLSLTVKAFDGAVQLRRSLPAVGRRDVPSSSDDGCFDWQLPADEFTSGLSRTRFARVGDATTLNFSFLFLCNKSLDVIRLSWRRDRPPISDNTSSSSSSSLFYALDLLSSTAAGANSTGNRSSPRCSEPEYFARNASDDVAVAWHAVPLPQGDGGCAYRVDVELPVVERRHAGTYSVEFGGGDQSVSYRVELVVLDRGTSGTADDPVPFRLRLRTCSNATWVRADDDDDGPAVTEYRLRQLVPDCVRCEASGSAAVDVQLLRADGLILGSEDAHSVYWYRDDAGRGRRRRVVVLLLRAPSDDYAADYYCVASASGPLGPEVGGDAKKRRVSRRRKYARRIRFRLTVR